MFRCDLICRETREAYKQEHSFELECVRALQYNPFVFGRVVEIDDDGTHRVVASRDEKDAKLVSDVADQLRSAVASCDLRSLEKVALMFNYRGLIKFADRCGVDVEDLEEMLTKI